jgi:Zn-dependent protease/predicted transcriptional regulator
VKRAPEVVVVFLSLFSNRNLADMKSSLRIGSIARIGIYVHWTFALLIAGIFAYYLWRGQDVAAAVVGVALILAVFACVVFHELGHALTARRFDVPTKDITLYPIGGVARLQRIPEEPMHEFWIAVAGPAVNVVIAAVLFLFIVAFGGVLSPEVLMQPGVSFLSTLMWLNVILVLFNLLPAFPMDGGRVLRALLATRIDYARATEIAASVGQGMAILFGLVGLISFNPILLFIAMFVYVGAQQEARFAMMRSLTQGISVRQAMMTRYRTLSSDDTLAVAVAELIAGSDQDFPVVDDGRLVGVLTRKDLMKALAEQGRDVRVGDVIGAECFSVEDSAMLDEAFVQMQASACPVVPVTRNDRLVGVLTLENVGELMMISSALRQAGAEKRVEEIITS